MNAYTGFALLSIGIALAGCSGGESGDGHAALPSGPRPSLILHVSLDTLRADRLETYGYARQTAPGLSDLASESIVFLNVAAQSAQTLISHKSLFSGLYPLRMAHRQTGADLESLASIPQPKEVAVSLFAEAPIALPRLLKEAGYRTVAFTGGGWMARRMGFAEGFDLFNGKGGDFAKVVPRTLNWLAENGPSMGQPTYLFVHAYDIHCPYTSREPYDTMFCTDHALHAGFVNNCGKPTLVQMDLGPEGLQAISDHYDGGIASADAYLSEIIDYLKRVGLYQQALIIVTSDHGDSLGQHGQIGHGGLYLEQLMVPLILKLPDSWGVEPARIEEAVELVDIMPTLLEAAGSEVPAGLDGRSLMPVIAGTSSGRSYLTAQVTFGEGKASVTSFGKRAILEPAKWLVIHDLGGSASEAFDLAADARGENDVASEQPERMMVLLSAMRERDRAMTAGGAVESGRALEAPPLEDQLDPESIEQLRSLGYID